jgi:hypothetical protein
MMAAMMPALSAAIAADAEQLPYVVYVYQPLGAVTLESTQAAAELLILLAGATQLQFAAADDSQLVQEEEYSEQVEELGQELGRKNRASPEEQEETDVEMQCPPLPDAGPAHHPQMFCAAQVLHVE